MKGSLETAQGAFTCPFPETANLSSFGGLRPHKFSIDDNIMDPSVFSTRSGGGVSSEKGCLLKRGVF